MEVWNLIWPNTRNAKSWLPYQQNNIEKKSMKFLAMFFENITNLKTIHRNFRVSEKTEPNTAHRRTVASKKSSYWKMEHLTFFFWSNVPISPPFCKFYDTSVILSCGILSHSFPAFLVNIEIPKYSKWRLDQRLLRRTSMIRWNPQFKILSTKNRYVGFLSVEKEV